ncbi:putative N-alpha-acetyltransferase 25; NatB auxiliary subunit [Paratrimastix pyriformis]|uniref:N-alpha-acetyltransferase 25 n=1 Tax=Paratrimastix pyriformis TaxID=342808 RepID=A0ABQ8UIZ6_9EUKA|nr:putative N-alpha-acetyltransferase 25; NatB auxiliary subunit [Paratrimastix pyriformis]
MSTPLDRRYFDIRSLIITKNFKEALKQCEQFLQKNPDALKIKALRALALASVGEEPELALRIANEVRDSDFVDEHAGRALTEAYQLMGKPGEMSKLWERALKASPNNEELAVKVFMSFVAENNFAKQQQLAMTLLKHHKKDKYLLWAVASMNEQVTTTGPNPTLRLAEMMLSRRLGEADFSAHPSAFQLYISLLVKQEKFAEAHAALKEPKYFRMARTPRERLDLVISVLTAMSRKAGTERWGDLQRIYKAILLGLDIDDWGLWQAYLDAALPLVQDSDPAKPLTARTTTTGAEPLEPAYPLVAPDADAAPAIREAATMRSPNEFTPDNTLEAVQAFLVEGQAKAALQKKRGAFLAEIEWVKRLGTAGLLDRGAMCSRLGALLAAYVARFCQKPACGFDLKPYLELLTPEARTALCIQLEREVVQPPEGTVIPTPAEARPVPAKGDIHIFSMSSFPNNWLICTHGYIIEVQSRLPRAVRHPFGPEALPPSPLFSRPDASLCRSPLQDQEPLVRYYQCIATVYGLKVAARAECPADVELLLRHHTTARVRPPASQSAFVYFTINGFAPISNPNHNYLISAPNHASSPAAPSSPTLARQAAGTPLLRYIFHIGCRSLGRSSAWHAGGKGIDTPQLHGNFFIFFHSPPESLALAYDLLLVASRMLWGAYQRDGKTVHLLRAVGLLEHAIDSGNASNYAFRLHLITIYTELGCFLSAWRHYNELDIKHIQRETTAHMLAREAFTSLNFAEVKAIADGVEAFRYEYLTESVAFARTAYEHENFMGLGDYQNFLSRCEHSLDVYACRADMALVKLFEHSSTPDEISQQCSQLAHLTTLPFTQEHVDALHSNADGSIGASPLALVQTTSPQKAEWQRALAWLHALIAPLLHAAISLAAAPAPAAATAATATATTAAPADLPALMALFEKAAERLLGQPLLASQAPAPGSAHPDAAWLRPVLCLVHRVCSFSQRAAHDSAPAAGLLPEIEALTADITGLMAALGLPPSPDAPLGLTAAQALPRLAMGLLVAGVPLVGVVGAWVPRLAKWLAGLKKKAKAGAAASGGIDHVEHLKALKRLVGAVQGLFAHAAALLPAISAAGVGARSLAEDPALALPASPEELYENEGRLLGRMQQSHVDIGRKLTALACCPARMEALAALAKMLK